MKELNIKITSVKIDVAAIEWPANATALKYYGDGLVCRITSRSIPSHHIRWLDTDPDESKEGAETSEIRITCGRSQVIGDLTQWHLPVGMKDLKLRGTGVTGKATSE
jgi:hypothetical protein